MTSHQHTASAFESKSKSYRLLMTREWDIIAPVPSNTLKATLTPKPLRLHHRSRRILLESHLITFNNNMNNNKSTRSYEQTIVKILVPQRKIFASPSSPSRSSNMSQSSSTDKNSISSSSQWTFIRPNRLSPGKNSNQRIINTNTISPTNQTVTRDRVNSEISDLAADHDNNDDDHHHHGATDQSNQCNGGWKEKYIFDLEDFVFVRQEKEVCFFTTRNKNENDSISVQRELIFTTQDEATDFVTYITQRITLERNMKEHYFLDMVGQTIQDVNQRVEYMIDIVGAVGLHKTGFMKGNPFVVVKWGHVILHQTDYIENSADPIWTIRTKSLFLLSVTIKELLMDHEKLEFFVYDYDFGESHRLLGLSIIPTSDIFLSIGQRREYSLTPVIIDSKERGYREGSIALRCRHATQKDREILKNSYLTSFTYSQSTLDEIDDQNQKDVVAGMGIADSIAPLTSIIEKKERVIVKDGMKLVQYKTRPGPDPDDKMDTEWLTNDEIQRYIYKPSRKWKDMGAGTLGTVYIEVLGCDSLPSREKNGIVGNARDTFVQIIYGDSRSLTDVIESSLSPRWLPWSNRAFTLHIKEQCAVIFLAVFDLDFKQDHTFIGRLCIPLVRFHANTEYLLDYKIHRNSTLHDRPSFGVLKIRLRLEIDHPRKYLLSSIQIAPPTILNVSDKKQFRSVLLTCYGDDWDQREYNLNGISKAVDEIRSYFSHISYAYCYVRDVILWRQLSSISIISKEFLLPQRSLQLFILSLIVLRFPRLLPSTFTGLLVLFSWTMMRTRTSQQNPWMRCSNFHDMIRSLLYDENMSPVTIVPDQEPSTLLKSDSEDMNSVHTTIMRAPSDYGNAKNDSKVDLVLDIFKPNLFSLQKHLIATIEWIRVIKRIITWEETALSFFFMMMFLFLTFALIFVPWMLVLRSVSTVFVLIVLSPVMKLVDLVFFQENLPLDEKNSRSSFKRMLRSVVNKSKLRSRIKMENETKIKDMKQSLFGSYNIKVPRLSVDLYVDVPMPTSTATPFIYDSVHLADLCLKETGLDKIRDHGQQIVGLLIPQIEKAFDYITPIGQIARQQSMLARSDPAASLSSDSIVLAVLKLLSVLILSALTTWVTVPILKLLIEKSTRALYEKLIIQ